MINDEDNKDLVTDSINYVLDENLQAFYLTEKAANRIFANVIKDEKLIKIRRIKRGLMIAAAIIITMGLIGFLYYHSQLMEKYNNSLEQSINKEIMAPAVVKSLITLSNGSKIAISELTTTDTIHIDGCAITKKPDGTISYDGFADNSGLNTLENPTGSRVISVKLNDGTAVSLNSGSKLTYPVSFNNAERIVEISGEAYFSVAHNPQKPFIVKKGKASIKVLGTVFNVKAFEEDKNVEVVLFKGRVEVSNGKKDHIKVLKPGQAAKIGDQLTIFEPDQIDETSSWKGEEFVFNDAPIEEIAKTLCRWYNIELEIKQASNTEKFSGIINKQNSLNQTVKMLQAAGVKIELSKNKLII